MITSSATTVIGFSLQGNTVPAGEGVLVILDVEGDADAACLSGLVLSDSGGNALDATVEDCTTISISGDDCPEGYDECGVCGGDNSSCADCAGVPNGGAVEDECGVCDGPGATYECVNGDVVCNASDCEDQPGGTVEVHYDSDADIAGFEFNVEGVTVTAVSGGAAEACLLYTSPSPRD